MIICSSPMSTVGRKFWSSSVVIKFLIYWWPVSWQSWEVLANVYHSQEVQDQPAFMKLRPWTWSQLTKQCTTIAPAEHGHAMIEQHVTIQPCAWFWDHSNTRHSERCSVTCSWYSAIANVHTLMFGCVKHYATPNTKWMLPSPWFAGRRNIAARCCTMFQMPHEL